MFRTNAGETTAAFVLAMGAQIKVYLIMLLLMHAANTDFRDFYSEKFARL